MTTVGVEHVRFALDGVPLMDATVDVVLAANEGSAPAPLPTERDPLRAGEDARSGTRSKRRARSREAAFLANAWSASKSSVGSSSSLDAGASSL